MIRRESVTQARATRVQNAQLLLAFTDRAWLDTPKPLNQMNEYTQNQNTKSPTVWYCIMLLDHGLLGSLDMEGLLHVSG